MFRNTCLAALGVALAAALAACASPGLRYHGEIAATDDARAHEVPTRRVALKDQAVVVTHVDWPEAGRNGGRHDVRWKWYEGDTLVADREKKVDFGRTPFRFSRSLAASDLGIGHYRVEVLVDGVKVDEQQFDVVAY